MKTYTERKLEQIRKRGLDKGLMLSCDIYYNEYGEDRNEQFVVKLHNKYMQEHFRSNHLRKALKNALKWIDEQ